MEVDVWFIYLLNWFCEFMLWWMLVGVVLTKMCIDQISATLTKGLLPNPQ